MFYTWNIPLYILCSSSTLGQHCFPITHYPRGLIVQLVGYVVQQAVTKYMDDDGNLRTAKFNVLDYMASVVAACSSSFVVDNCGYYYHVRLLQRDDNFSTFGEVVYKLSEWSVHATNCIKLGRRSDLVFLKMRERLVKESKEVSDPSSPQTAILIDYEEDCMIT